MGNSERRIILGKLGAPVGLKGWLRVQLDMDNPHDLVDYQPCYIDKQGQAHQITVEQVKQQNTKWLVKLATVDDRTTAEAYRLCPLWVERDTLPECDDDQYYWADLEGAVVRNHGKELGTIDHLYHNAGTDIMVVKMANGKQGYIPFLLNDVVLNVDLAQKVVETDWPEDAL